MKELSSRGLGLDKKKAEIITAEQEDIMWRKGILGRDSPAKLLDTVLFQLGLHFALRAGQEHRTLRFGPNSQITVRFEQGMRTHQLGFTFCKKRSASCVNERGFQAILRTTLYVQRQQHDCMMLEWTNS